MEERKRPAIDENHNSAPPPKKQAIIVNGANSKFDAEMPWKDDINVRLYELSILLIIIAQLFLLLRYLD